MELQQQREETDGVLGQASPPTNSAPADGLLQTSRDADGLSSTAQDAQDQNPTLQNESADTSKKANHGYKRDASNAHRNSVYGELIGLRSGSVPTSKGTHHPITDDGRRYSISMRLNTLGPSDAIQKLSTFSEALTQQQISAFKEAFNLFDKNGGGTFDAVELRKTLDSVGICLEKEEIRDVMLKLDKDRSGEINFEEFLDMMTNSERFLEAFVARHGNKDSNLTDLRRERDILLFDALIEFMKKSALRDAHEIVGYYAKSCRKAIKAYNQNKGAHVVGHYADGARLIGLTEKQLLMQLKQLTLNQNYEDDGTKSSPYAHPLRLSVVRSVTAFHGKFRKRQLNKRRKIITKAAFSLDGRGKQDSFSVATDDSSKLQENQSAISAPPAIETQLRIQCMSESHKSETETVDSKVVAQRDQRRKEDGGLCHDKEEKTKEDDIEQEVKVFEYEPGWLSQRTIVYNVDISVPKKFRNVCVDRLPSLRKTVKKAKSRFIREISQRKMQHNIRHYRELDSRRVPSTGWNKQFLKAFSAYSCAETSNRTAVSPEKLKNL